MTLALNYIGSKKTLYDTLDAVFKQYLTPTTVFADLFAGTGIVSYNVQQKYRCPVITNDMQFYAHVLNRALLSQLKPYDQIILKKKIDQYNQLSGVIGFVTLEYSPPKRSYFTRENAEKIDAMRICLESDRSDLSDDVYYYLLASIIVAADRIANTSCIYASYLKKFKASALKPITLVQYVPNNINQKSTWYNCDALILVDTLECDVLYMDPPYNARQYSQYYHILETIAKYDHPNIHGKTGVRDQLYRSPFSSKRQVVSAFQSLISKVKAKTLIVSYNNQGLISHDHMFEILKTHGSVTLHTRPYRKFKPHNGVDNTGELYEYIFVSEKTE